MKISKAWSIVLWQTIEDLEYQLHLACFFTLDNYPSQRIYGSIKELLSQDNPPLYRDTSLQDFNAYYYNKGLGGNSALYHFLLQR
ncbi:hypothetical protein HN51_071589 [Arachis hypogaea]